MIVVKCSNDVTQLLFSVVEVLLEKIRVKTGCEVSIFLIF